MDAIKFRSNVNALLRTQTLLGDGTTVLGQSLSYVQTTLREKGYKNVAEHSLRDALDQHGFKVVRGRQKNAWKNGHGAECNIVLPK